jgi:hypothetical protein
VRPGGIIVADDVIGNRAFRDFCAHVSGAGLTVSGLGIFLKRSTQLDFAPRNAL